MYHRTCKYNGVFYNNFYLDREARAEADFEINQKAEMEIETILMHLENQNQAIHKILQKPEHKNILQQLQ